MNTAEKSLKYNKMCAEFLMWLYNSQTSIHFPEGTWVDTKGIGHCAKNGMIFHTDWNWIDVMLNAINAMRVSIMVNSHWNEFNEKTYHQVIIKKEVGEMSKDRAVIYDSKTVYEWIGNTNTDKKEAVIDAIYNYLIWYNENKSN